MGSLTLSAYKCTEVSDLNRLHQVVMDAQDLSAIQSGQMTLRLVPGQVDAQKYKSLAHKAKNITTSVPV